MQTRDPNDPSAVGGAGGTGGFTTPAGGAYKRLFIRFDIAVTGGRPWRVRVEGKASEWDPGNAQPTELRGVINLSGLVADLALFDKEEPPLISLHGDLDDIVRIGTAPGGFGSIPVHERAQAVGLSSEMYPIKGAGHNDTASSQLCPECVPLIRRFLFNTIKEDSKT